MHRLKHDKEMDLMTPSTNRKNIQQFSDLVEHFFYDLKTEKEIRQNLSPITKPFPANYFDQKLDLNSQFRAWYEVPIDRYSDVAFEKYKQMLYRNFLHYRYLAESYNDRGLVSDFGQGLREPTESELKCTNNINLCDRYGVASYETWIAGKVSIGKNQQKLFKYCLKNGFLRQDQVDKLNTIKTKGNKLYICITRNPVDYLFSSTDQSYTSCLDAISSRGEGCYWMGLGALNTDNSRAMVFLSNGKIRNCSLHDHSFKHFKYLSRAWMFLGKQDKMYILKSYPEDKVGFYNKLEGTGLPMDDLGAFEQSRLNFNVSRFENGDTCNIYLDSLGVEQRLYDDLKNRSKGNKRKWYYKYGGITGSLHHFDYDGSFDDIYNFDDLLQGGTYCEDCGEYCREDYAYYFENLGNICESCYNNHYITCQACGNGAHNEDSFTGPDNEYYCEHCFNDRFLICGCGDAINKEDAIYVESEIFCKYCVYDHCFKCESCNEMYLHEDRWMHKGFEYCRDCHYDLFVQCDSCGKDVDIDYVIDIDYVSYCEDCAEEIKEERDEAINETV